MLEAAIEAGADDCLSDDAGHSVVCATDSFGEVQKALEAKFGTPERAKLVWKPQSTVDLNQAQAETMVALVEALEDNDDVQTVYSNFEVSDEIMKKLAAG